MKYLDNEQIPYLVQKFRDELSPVFESIGFTVEVSEEGHMWCINVVEYNSEFDDYTELYGLCMDKVLASAYEYHGARRGE